MRIILSSIFFTYLLNVINAEGFNDYTEKDHKNDFISFDDN